MGHVTVVGGCRAKAPSTGILAGSLAVGTTVKLMEGGTAVEYLVVNQGKPSGSSLYDDSCDGTWLLRKDCLSERVWKSNNVNTYANSNINTWLNGDFFNSFGDVERAVIKQVKIPYCVGDSDFSIKSGTNGLIVWAFLLGGYELGWTTNDSDRFPVDGAKLDYFEASSGGNTKRIANFDNAPVVWFLRSLYKNALNTVVVVKTDGEHTIYGAKDTANIRPALIIPSNALFDGKTMLLKGVA